MSIYLVLTFFMTVAGAIAVYGYRRYARPGQVYEQLSRPVVEASAVAASGGIKPRRTREFKLLGVIGGLIPTSVADSSLTKRMLSWAGYRSEQAVRTFYGLKVFSTVLMLALGLAGRDLMGDNQALHLIFPIAAALAGYLAPSFILERQITKRQKLLRMSLPDALDLLVIAVEAGLGLDQALQYVSSELRIAHVELTDELSLVTLEIRAGKRRADALKNLGDRTGEPELRKLVAILIQNDRFGTSVAESLRNHSDFMRIRRRQEAEERAAKVGVKLVFPIFFFILPSMMLVTAGPGVLQVVKYLLPMMKIAP